jgi:hypothetical protein
MEDVFVIIQKLNGVQMLVLKVFVCVVFGLWFFLFICLFIYLLFFVYFFVCLFVVCFPLCVFICLLVVCFFCSSFYSLLLCCLFIYCFFDVLSFILGAMKLLEPIKQHYPQVSYADLYTFSGVGKKKKKKKKRRKNKNRNKRITNQRRNQIFINVERHKNNMKDKNNNTK